MKEETNLSRIRSIQEQIVTKFEAGEDFSELTGRLAEERAEIVARQEIRELTKIAAQRLALKNGEEEKGKDLTSPAYIRSNIKELEDETCKILTKENASTVTISKLDERAGCFVPIMTIDVSEYNSGSFCNTELFQVEVE